MSEIDSSVRPSVLDYKLRSITAPKYKYVRIPMNNHASASVNVTATSTELLEWKLPTQVYNLARSYIAYSLTVPAAANDFNVTFEDTFDIAQSATFGSAGGVDLVNIQHLQNFAKIARKLDTPIEDFMGNDDMSQLYKCNSTPTDNPLPFKYRGGIIDGANPLGTPINTPKDAIVETKYIHATPAVNTLLYRHRQFPLGAISGTLFAVDRDFYSPVEQYLRITAGIGDKIAFATTAAATPDTGAPSLLHPLTSISAICTLPWSRISLLCMESWPSMQPDSYLSVSLTPPDSRTWEVELAPQPTFRFRSVSSMVSASSVFSTPYGTLSRS